MGAALPRFLECKSADSGAQPSFALAGEFHRDYLEKHADDTAAAASAAAREHERRLKFPLRFPGWQRQIYGKEASEFLKRKKLRLHGETEIQFLRAIIQAMGRATDDSLRATNGDFSSLPHATSYPPPEPDYLDAMHWFDRFAEAAGLAASTMERWRPVIKQFTAWAKDSNLAKVTKTQIIAWKNVLLQQHVRVGRQVKKRAPRTVKDVHLAALKALFQYLVDENKLTVNPVSGVVVRNVETEKDDDEKGFTDNDAKTILKATLHKGSRLLSIEMRAARRWVPWICAYTGARVNEITSLQPSNIVRLEGIDCFSLPKDRTKGRKKRLVPIHSDLVKQGFLAYVEERKKLRMPLFYDPARSSRRQGFASSLSEGRGEARGVGQEAACRSQRLAQPWLAAPMEIPISRCRHARAGG
jgi:site-specific recombinase XerD